VAPVVAETGRETAVVVVVVVVDDGNVGGESAQRVL
jgi:hypothetical protein